MDPVPDFVLYVHGPPRSGAAQDACEQLIEGICGKIENTIEGPFKDLDSVTFSLKRILRSQDVRAEPLPPQRGILVMTDLSNLPLLVTGQRRKLTKTHPELANMLWCVFMDDDQPFFERSARELGEFNSQLDWAPTWTVKIEEIMQSYLVLTPRTDSTLARRNARLLVPSGFTRLTSNGFPRPTPQEMEEGKTLYAKKP